MRRDLFNKILDKIPDVVAEIAEYYGETNKAVIEIVREFTPDGKLISKSDFFISTAELEDHIRKAEGRPDFKVDTRGESVIVRRELLDGRYFEVEYRRPASVQKQKAPSSRKGKTMDVVFANKKNGHKEHLSHVTEIVAVEAKAKSGLPMSSLHFMCGSKVLSICTRSNCEIISIKEESA